MDERELATLIRMLEAAPLTTSSLIWPPPAPYDPTVVQALGYSGDRRVVQPLTRALLALMRDQERRVNEAEARYGKVQPFGESPPELERILESHSVELRPLIEALTRLQPGSVDLLLGIGVKEPHELRRMAALKALIRMRFDVMAAERMGFYWGDLSSALRVEGEDRRSSAVAAILGEPWMERAAAEYRDWCEFEEKQEKKLDFEIVVISVEHVKGGHARVLEVLRAFTNVDLSKVALRDRVIRHMPVLERISRSQAEAARDRLEALGAPVQIRLSPQT